MIGFPLSNAQLLKFSKNLSEPILDAWVRALELTLSQISMTLDSLRRNAWMNLWILMIQI